MSIGPTTPSDQDFATIFDLGAAPGTRAVQLLSSRDTRQARHAFGVTELLRGRDDLRGVYAPADLVEEFTRWCA
jgi:hypothetical protein